jgi:PST family polysaccharide transporter
MSSQDGTTGALSRTVARGVGLASAGYVFTTVLSLGQYLALARLASPREFGELAGGSIVVGVGMLVSESGMLAALVQRRDRLEEAAATAVIATVLGGVLLSLVALAASPLVGAFFHNSTTGHVAAALSGCVFLAEVSIVPEALMQRRFSFMRRVVLDPVSTFLGAAAGIAGTAAGLGVWGLVLGVYAALGSQAVLAWVFARWRPRLRLASFGMWRELAGYGRHVLAGSGLQRVNLEGRTAIVGHGLGASTLGQYSMAFRLAIQPRALLVNGVSYVLMPALARIADDAQRFRSATLRAFRSVVIAAVPLNLLLVPFGRSATVLLFGDRWAPCGSALAWMAGLGILGAADSVASESSKASGQPEWLPRMHGLRTAAVLGLTAALLPWGLNGAAFALTAAELVAASLSVYAMSRVTGAAIRSIVAQGWEAAVGGVALLAVAVPLRVALDPSRYPPAVGIPLLCAEALAGLLAYACVLAAVAPRDLRLALDLARRVLARRGGAAAESELPGMPAPLP